LLAVCLPIGARPSWRDRINGVVARAGQRKATNARCLIEHMAEDEYKEGSQPTISSLDMACFNQV